MRIEVEVPPLGESVVEAVVADFRAEEGSGVAKGQEILELETDKVNQVLYAPEGGAIHYLVKVGDHVKVGQKIAWIDTAATVSAPTPKPTEAPPKAAVAPPPPAAEKKASPTAATGEKPLRLGQDEFIKALDKPSQSATAPASSSASPPTPRTSRRKMSSLRRTIASRLVEVKQNTAMLTTFNEVDMSAVMAIRAQEKDSFQQRYGVKLGFMSFFVKAVTSALKAFPEVNSYIEGEEIVRCHNYDIGIAISTEKGLVVPVVRGCDTLSFGEIERAIEQFAIKGRSGKLTLDELRGGSFTITNGGTFGSLLSTPILNPPQSAILGMHTIQKRPVAVADRVEVRSMMYLALSYDHRLIDGKEAVQFLVQIKKNIEEPSRLLLDL